jgi:hypothetical protein
LEKDASLRQQAAAEAERLSRKRPVSFKYFRIILKSNEDYDIHSIVVIY